MKQARKILIAVVVVSAITISSVFAKPSDFKNAVGFYSLNGLNLDSAYGLQYHRWCTDKIGFQTQGYINYYDQGSYSNPLNYSISVQILYKLFEMDIGERAGSCLYAWASAGHHGYIDRKVVYPEDETLTEQVTDTVCLNAQVGLGFGIDIMCLEHISLPIEFGYMGEFPSNTVIGFVFGSGIRYRF